VLSRSRTATVVASIGTPSEIRYDAPYGPVLHILTGLVPRESYAVRVAASGAQVRVVVRSGAGRRANVAGILIFRTTAGRLTP
jgi:hypothetical protein